MVSAASAGLLPAYPTQQLQYSHQPALIKTIAHHEEHAPANYDFEYSVHDAHTGDIKSQHESRHGDAVHGQYSLVDADNHLRTVEYSADAHSGFNAQVRREPLGHKAAPIHATYQQAAPIHATYQHAAPIASYHHAAPVTAIHAAPVHTTYQHAAPVATYHHAAPVATYHHAAPVTAIHAAPITAVHHASPVAYSSSSIGHSSQYSQGVHHQTAHNDYYHH